MKHSFTNEAQQARQTFLVWLSAFFCLLASLCLPLSAAPVINNNAGTWTDNYNDSIGISAVNQTVVDATAGVAKLATGQSSGDFTTVVIKPTSFDAWGQLTLQGSWSAPANVQVSVLDPLNGDAVVLGPQSYTGPISLASLSATTYPELKVRVALTAGATRPEISRLRATWNPISRLLVDKTAPATVQAGETITYRLRYSVSYVDAQDLVVWDRLPHTAQGTMTYPTDYGQNDNLTFVQASDGGQFTSTAITVKGVNIPAGSVYWDLGNKPAGTTATLLLTLKSKNGTLDGTQVTNSFSADAANAAQIASDSVATTITSVPAPKIQKRASTGIYPLPSGNFTQPGTVNRFTVRADNLLQPIGRETMYQTVVYDNLSDLVGKMDPDFGGAGIPVASITPVGGTYIANYTPPSGGDPFPAVVWTGITLPPGGTFLGAFTISLGSGTTNVDAGLLSADLAVDKSVTPASTTEGGTVTFTVTYTVEVENVGAGTISGVTVADLLPPGVTYVPNSVEASLFPVPPPPGSASDTFNTSSTYNVPAGVTSLTVEAWGGGGGGGSAFQNAAGGDGQAGAGGGAGGIGFGNGASLVTVRTPVAARLLVLLHSLAAGDSKRIP